MPLRPGIVGRQAGPLTTVVDPARARAYAAATNDAHPDCRSGAAVPPVFGVTPSWDLVMGLVREAVPEEHQFTIVHGWQDMHFARAMEPGEALVSRAEIHGIRGSRLGTELVVRARSDAADGSPVVDVYTTLVVRGLTDDADVGPDRPASTVPAADVGKCLAEAVIDIDEDQTYRYKDASGDTMPIHVDDAVARSVGLPGIIVHGLCTMAMCGQVVLATAEAHPSELRRLAVRFTRPVLPGDQVTVTVHGSPAPPVLSEARTYAFEARARGKVVVKDGLAVVGPRRAPAAAGG